MSLPPRGTRGIRIPPPSNIDVEKQKVWNPTTSTWDNMQQPVRPTDTLGVSGTMTITKVPLTPAAPAAVSVALVSTSVLAAAAGRKGVYLVNTSTGYISLGFGAAAVLWSGITLNPGGGVFWIDEYSLVTGAINAIASVAASNLGVQAYS